MQSVEQRPAQAPGTERLGSLVEGAEPFLLIRTVDVAASALRDELEQPLALRSSTTGRSPARAMIFHACSRPWRSGLLLPPRQGSFAPAVAFACARKYGSDLGGDDQPHRQPSSDPAAGPNPRAT